MGRVKAGSMRLREAAEWLELSYRQGKRVWARYRGGGGKALQHRNCGRRSNRAHPAEFRRAVLARGGTLCGFRSHASERTPGQRRWAADPCRELAALDA